MARVFTDAGAMSLASIAGLGKFFDGGIGAWAFWLYCTGSPVAERGLVGMGDFTTDVGWWVNLTTTRLINAIMPFATANRVRVSTIAAALNAWTHVVVNSASKGTASTEFTFFINGVADAGTQTTAGSGTAPAAGSFAAKIGPGPGTSAAANTTAPPANYGITAFWNRIITPAEALSLAIGCHPLQHDEGLVEIWDMEDVSHEAPYVGQVPLIPGATVPAMTFDGPAIQPMPAWDRPRIHQVKPRSYDRARYFVPAAGGFTPLNRRTLHPFGSHVGGRTMR